MREFFLKASNSLLENLSQRPFFMSAWRDKRQIRRSIVDSDAVQVMDIFSMVEAAAEDLLHDDAVLQSSLIRAGVDKDVSVSMVGSPAFPVGVGSAWKRRIPGRAAFDPSALEAVPNGRTGESILAANGMNRQARAVRANNDIERKFASHVNHSLTQAEDGVNHGC